jgi:hypothetical protein
MLKAGVMSEAVPASDPDYKAVHLPEGRDILLQRVEDAINVKTKQDGRQENTAPLCDINRRTTRVPLIPYLFACWRQ